jgi:GNAT superfamily N-acetyltransferase
MEKSQLNIRLLKSEDIPQIAEAFAKLGWHKPASLYKQYWMEQSLGMREVYVAFVEGEFAGYLTICWKSPYEPFRTRNIPEVVDFIMLPKFRRMGIGTKLMDKAENEIIKVSSIAGIGVGMTPDYGAAQRMYVLRGYIPDGLGLHWRDHYPQFGEDVKMDDDLALYFTKELK